MWAIFYHFQVQNGQKVDFEKVVPPFWGFSTKTDLVVHGFTVHGFLFPQKIREK